VKAKTDELDEVLHASITALTKAGDAYVESGKHDLALEKYREAFRLLPAPFEKWEAATWILTAIGDTLFSKADYGRARETLQQAMHCPGAIGNPFLHLRLGQAQFELKNIERAKDELARAYMGGGDEIFKDEDPKYLRFIKEILRPREDDL
jgi:tetratricopeptide (TPR) repeat protein